MWFRGFKKYLISCLFTIILVTFLVLTFLSGTYFKLVFFTVLVPLLLGMLAQEFMLGVSAKELGNRLYILVNVMVIPLLGIYVFSPEALVSLGGVLIYYSIIFIFGLLVWNVTSHELKYIPKINIEIMYIYLAMFLYWLGGMVVFSLGTICVGVILAVYQRSKFKFIKWVLSISYGLISLIFWGDYILYILDKYQGVFTFQTINFSNFIVFGEFLVLGISIGYMFQMLYMLLAYFPEKNNFYGSRKIKEIKRVNKLLLDRFEEKHVSIVSIFISIFILTALVVIHSSTLFVPIELFIGVVFVILLSVNQYLSHFIKK